MLADLHCHTRLSDGSMGIDNLIVLAKKSNVQTISITDHDCLAGNVRGKRIGEQHGVQVIPGVELSATDTKRNQTAHLLCYLPDSPDRLEGLCRRNLLESKKCAQYMIVKTSLRYPVTPDFIIKCATGSTGVYKQHIMHALMESGLTDRIFGDVYNDLFSKENEENVLRAAKYADVFDVLHAIHEAGGVAVLAHPALYGNLDLMQELTEQGLDGIEVWHPSADAETVEMLRTFAKTNDLLMTGGSDFHGMYGVGACALGTCSTPDDQLDALLNCKARRRRRLARAAKAAAAQTEESET